MQADVIIIGAGHNGLVTACYLARAGRKVLVLERRPVVGGACVTEEIFPGFKVSTAAYVNSLFRNEIIQELQLEKHGYEILERSPSSFTPFPDGRSLMLGPDAEMTHREICKFSQKDADAYPQYEEMLERIADVIEPLMLQTPPNILKPGIRDYWRLFQTSRRFRKLGPALSEAIEMLSGPATPILDRWFESEQLKVTLATDAIIGAMASPSMPGTAYVLFHHVMGETNGKRGVWGYVRGGMGGLTQALASSAKESGAEIQTDADVDRILVENNRVKGVSLSNGERIEAPIVVSNADANVTFLKLLKADELPSEFRQAVQRINYDSASLKINVALSELPNFIACPGVEPGPQHRGTIHICPTMEHLERAYDDAKYGQTSRRPVLECTIPSVVDETVAPPGKHLMSMFIQYAPYHLKGTTWEEERERFADRCFDLLNEYAPNFKDSVLDRQVLSPVDLERTFNLTGGNIFQGAMSLHQMLSFRPVTGYADHRTPIRGLFLCGAASHPGGGVMGISGKNAASVVLKG